MSISRTKTSLLQEANGKKYVVYPASYADIIFLVNDDGTSSKITIQEKIKEIDELLANNSSAISKLEQSIKENNRFKGTFNSLKALELAIPFSELKSGDYAIIAHENKDDELVIFDATENSWITKGNVIQGTIKMINGKTPNELGNVIVYIDDIEDLREELNSFAKKTDLNRVEYNSVKYNREWNSTTTYHKNDLVIYENCIYIAISDNEILNIVPNLTGNTDWELIGVTTTYVEENGGKIDIISVNGVNQVITNKKVDISIPTKTSQLTNDSDLATNASVDAKIEAIPTPDVSGQIKTHNEDQNAHPYILDLLPTVTKLEG